MQAYSASGMETGVIANRFIIIIALIVAFGVVLGIAFATSIRLARRSPARINCFSLAKHCCHCSCLYPGRGLSWRRYSGRFGRRFCGLRPRPIRRDNRLGLAGRGLLFEDRRGLWTSVKSQQSQREAAKEKDCRQNRSGSGERVRCTSRAEEISESGSATTHAQSTTLGALQKYNPDQGHRNNQLNHNEHALHGNSAFQPLHIRLAGVWRNSGAQRARS
jgi:hypothetical protein